MIPPFLILVILGLGGTPSIPDHRFEPVTVKMQTDLGLILLEVFPDQAPVTVANFLRYVDEGLYDGGSFYRTVRADNQPSDSVKIAVVQGDLPRENRSRSFPAILLERTSDTGILHTDGVVSMARAGPDTATSSFFICVGDQPALDFAGSRNQDGQGFAAFGRVVEGMEVVRAINASPADGQRLSPPVTILKVFRR